MQTVTAYDVLRLQDFGLERLDEDQAIIGFARKTDAKIVRWLDFAKGALLFLTVPGDPESGEFFVFDRGRSAFYPLALPVESKSGGYRDEQFEQLVETYALVAMAKNPKLLRKDDRQSGFWNDRKSAVYMCQEGSDGSQTERHGRNGRSVSQTVRQPPCVHAAIP